MNHNREQMMTLLNNNRSPKPQLKLVKQQMHHIKLLTE